MATIELLGEITETIKCIGENSTLNLLRKARLNADIPDKIRALFKIISDEMGFPNIESPIALKESDERKIMLGFLCFFGDKKIGIKSRDLNVLSFNLSRQSFSKYKKIIVNTYKSTSKAPLDVLVNKHYENINRLINKTIK